VPAKKKKKKKKKTAKKPKAEKAQEVEEAEEVEEPEEAQDEAEEKAEGAAEEDATEEEVEEEEEEEEEVEEEVEEEIEEVVEEVVDTAPVWVWGTGRRKTAVARVRVRPGAGQVVVNKKALDAYFPTRRLQARAVEPLKAVKLEGSVDVFANISGGGITGQAEAMLMGLARSLSKYDETTGAVLRSAGYLTRDARMVERKKYGRRGARRRYQYSKR
jgi:small subunit ribosomal protein S9